MVETDPGGHEEGAGRSDGSRPEGAERVQTAISSRKRLPSRRMMTVLGSIAVAAIVLSAAWILSGISRSQVTIVAIIPLSGPSSYLVEMEEAMYLTVEKLNRWGGINGVRLRLVVEDCESSHETAVAKLIEAEEKYHPLAVVTAVRGAAVPMSEVAEEKGVVLISVGATAENLTAGKGWTFRYYSSPSYEAKNALDVLESLDAKSLGILCLDDVYGHSVRSRLTEALMATEVEVESYIFPANATDFTDAVATVAHKDAVFAVALRHQYSAIFLALNSSGYAGHVMGALEASIPELWSMPEAQGCYVSAPIMYGSTTSVDKDFMEEFEQRYGEPLTHQGAIGSDVLKLIWSILSDKEISRENLRNVLSMGFVHSGILGVVTLDQGVPNADIQVYPAVIEGGELRYL